MNLKPNMTYYAQVGSERQLLYYVDWPRYEFKIIEEEVKGKKVLKKNKHFWHRIAMEFPTRMVETMSVWLNSGKETDIIIGAICGDKNVQQWFLQNAKIESAKEGLGRTVNISVVVVHLSYTWARRLK